MGSLECVQLGWVTPLSSMVASGSPGNSQSTKERVNEGGRPVAKLFKHRKIKIYFNFKQYVMNLQSTYLPGVSNKQFPEQGPPFLHFFRIEFPSCTITVYPVSGF